MQVAVEIAIQSASNQGGPFGAVIADSTGKILECGWNHVVQWADSTCHAEVHCMRRLQRKLKTNDLSTYHDQLSMYCSCSPCIQCFGAIYWSGLKRIFAAAGKEDAEAIGFDEGPISEHLWQEAEKEKGIVFTPAFGRTERALLPFKTFQECCGTAY